MIGESLGRVALLVRLRLRLTWRMMSGRDAKLLSGIFGAVMMLALFAGLVRGAQAVASAPDASPLGLVHMFAVAAFFMQLATALTGLSSNEFFDLSRLAHLPIKPREIAAAQVCGAVLSPAALLFSAPLVAWVSVHGSFMGLWHWLPALLLAPATSSVAALALQTTLERVFARRRLRDLATLLGALLGIVVLLGWHTLRNGGVEQLTQGSLGFPVAISRWAPPGWIASLVAGQGLLSVLIAVGGLALWFAVLLGVVGRNTLVLLQEGGGGRSGSVGRGRSRLGGGGAAALRSLSWRLLFRDPISRAQLIQSSMYVLAPIVGILIAKGSAEASALELFGMMAVLLPFCHMTFLLSVFAFDGKGVGTLLLTPWERGRILFQRGVGVLRAMLVFDAGLVLVAALGIGVWSGQLVEFLSLAPLALAVMALFEMAVLSLGLPFSVVSPLRMGGGGQARVGSGHQGQGCGAMLARVAIFLPASILGAVYAGIALYPLASLVPPMAKLPGLVDPIWVTVSMPLALLLAGGGVWLAAKLSAGALARREFELMAALTDGGE